MTVSHPVSVGVKITLAALGLLVALWLLVQLRSIVALVLVALTLATGLHPIVEWLHRFSFPPKAWQLPRWLIILTTLLAMVFAMAGLFTFLGSILWHESAQLWQDLPARIDGWSGWLADLRKDFPQIPSEKALFAMAQGQMGEFQTYLWQTTSAVLGVLGFFGSAITVLVLTFYMLLERVKLRAAFLALIPPEHQPRVARTTEEALVTMGGWLRGQTILVSMMTAVISAVMALFGLPHPILLGIVGGIGELIPMVGPIAAGLIAVPLAFFTMPLWVGIAVLCFFIVLSIVEGNFVVPKVMEANVDLSPFYTVVAVLAGAALAGVIGALLALPLAAAARVFLQRIIVPEIQRK